MQESAGHERGLNREQWAAVSHGQGPLLVVAGAGTGKTRVITERIRFLLETQPDISGENILGLTFTDKAAAEMKQRVIEAVGGRGRLVWLGTYHAFCLQIILRDLNPDMQVLETADHWILLRRRLAEFQLEHFKRLAEPGQFLHDFLKFFSRCQDELISPDDYQQYVDRLHHEHEGRKFALSPDEIKEAEAELARQQEVARAYRISDRLLREANAATFGGFQLEAVEQLRRNPEALQKLQQRFRYMLVDEYQDTNIAQIELLWLLAGDARNIVAVGDDDQAIYRFRGASFGSFKLFAEKFLGALRGTRLDAVRTVTLAQNYRSTKRILAVAGQVIEQNRDRFLPDKQLVTQNPAGAKIRIVTFAGPAEEAHWITTDLERLHRAGERWKNMAVLYRQHNHRDQLVQSLVLAKIPFVIKNLSILTNTLVRDVIAYLNLIAAPSDNIACARVLGVPAWGFEPKDLVRLAQRVRAVKKRTLMEELENPQDGLAFLREPGRVAELLDWLGEMRRKAGQCTASELLDELIAGLGLTLLASDADARHLDRFACFVREWERKNEQKTLVHFIEYVGYFFESGEHITLEEESEEDAVQLMTVHAAKGLEFNHVFVMRLSARSFPVSARSAVLEFPPALMKEEKPEGDFHIQEERRLFYVALTRARRRLTLTAVVTRRSKPSPFLEDILSEPQIQYAHIEQSEPQVLLPQTEPAATALPANAADLPLFAALERNRRAYSQIAVWAETYRPPLSEPLMLSASAIETYENCGLQYLLQQIWSLRGGPQAPMTFGNVMHATIRYFIEGLRQGRRMPLDELLTIYQREWTSAGFRDSYQEEEYRKAGIEQLQPFHASCREMPEVLHQEKSFRLDLAPNLVVTGRIDQINRLPGGAVEIIDYKTGRPKTAKYADKSLQLSLYAMAAREVLDLEPQRLVLYNLETNERVETSRSEKALAAAREEVLDLAGLIRSGEFSPTSQPYRCHACEFQPICPKHEQLVALRAAP